MSVTHYPDYIEGDWNPDMEIGESRKLLNGDIVKCVKINLSDDSDECDGCYYNIMGDQCYCGESGNCCSFQREDETHVKFLKVED